MKIKVYAAGTMKEVRENIRRDLGDGAIVLHSEKKTLSDEKGKNKTVFQVVAAVGECSTVESTQTNNLQEMTSDPACGESILDDEVGNMIDESLLQTFIEETRIADEVGRNGMSGGTTTIV